MSVSAVNEGATHGEAGPVSDTNPKGSLQAAGDSTGFPLPDVSVWAKWVLSPVLMYAFPFYKKILRTEEVIEKSVEAASEEADKVAEVVKKVAYDIANDLPVDGSLRKMVIKIEEVADMVIIYAEEAEAFIHKVDEIKEEVEEVTDKIMKEAESYQEGR